MLRALVFSCLILTSLQLPLTAHAGNQQENALVRIQLQAEDQKATIKVSATSKVLVLTAQGWKEIGLLLPEYQLQITGTNQGLAVSGLSNTQTYQALKLESPNDEAMIQSDQAWYRGDMTFRAKKNNTFSVINDLSLEQYLYSVVPSEMPASWPLEALKAQAVAARTYALSHLDKNPNSTYDLSAGTASQVYQGVKIEHPRSNQAVQATRDEILTYQSSPILAYFHSSSGGRTENGSDLWAAKPYLKSVSDLDQASPKYTWHQQVSQTEMQSALRKEFKLNLGSIIALEAQAYTSTGRIKTLKILGTQGQKELDAMKFRSALNLNSTFFNVGAVSTQGELIREPNPQEIPMAFQFAGRGWGHGLGMSQWGARQMAINGYNYQYILSHYYQGVTLVKMNLTNNKVAQTF